MIAPMTGEDESKTEKRRRRGPRKATPKSLENGALFYLERFATSRANLRRVMLRRVERSSRHHGTDPEEGARIVEDLLDKFERLGLLDDAAYAEMRVRGLRRRGASKRLINAQLRQKGLTGEAIDAALDAHEEESDAEDTELEAAVTLARKRRMGPFRPAEARKDNREKDLAALARAGFSYETALEVIDAETVEELESKSPGRTIR